MDYIHGILTVALFLGYLILWYIKRRTMLANDGVDANVEKLAIKPIQKYFWALEKVMTVTAAVFIGLHTFFKNSCPALQCAELFDSSTVQYIGFTVGVVGLGLCRIAQITIGSSWRVGIDDNAKPGLVTAGIYQYIRNPTYSGLFLLCAGVWLLNPTFLFAYWVLVFVIMMEFQVRCEEEYLLSQYGDKFAQYSKTVKRYIPFIY